MRGPTSLVLLLSLAGLAPAQVSYPMTSHVLPVAVQRGKTTTVNVYGTQNFAGTYKALFEGTGITAEVVAPKGSPATARVVTLKLTVAADAKPGPREFRTVSRLGVSSIGQLVVSEHPVVVEKAKNDTRETATPITVPCTVAGQIEAIEDVDHFRFSAKAGQTITFEVLCARIQDKIHDLQKHADPILTLYDPSGRELAANDDFYFADPMLAYTFEKAGDYVIQVRDSKYDGDARWVYALLVTDQPYASHVYPSAVQAGKRVEVEPIGSASAIKPRIAITAPATPGMHELTLDTGAGTTNLVPVFVSPLPQVNEQEPNDTPATATRVVVPCGINGRIDKARDVDHFVFAGKKGQAIRFEVKARRFGTLFRSSLDSMLEILNGKGVVVAQNDDTNGKDSALTFTAPADGDYTLRIRDLNSKGGPTFVYHIEADFAKPDFVVRCDGDKAMVAPGSRAAWYVQVTRVNGFAGPVSIDVRGLPAGVTVNPLTIPAGETQGLLVLSAARDAKIDASNVTLTATAELTIAGKTEKATRPVLVAQEIYFPGGGRGVFHVTLQTVAVTEPGDILDIRVSPQEVVLKPGGEVRIEVEITRKPGYDKGVSLDIMLRHLGQVYGNTLPRGVTFAEGKSKTLLGSASKGYIVIKADATAPEVEKVPVSVVACVSVNFVVKMSYSSAVIPVSVRKAGAGR
jgi:Bacterial pre-peptidase C-terminal domain